MGVLRKRIDREAAETARHFEKLMDNLGSLERAVDTFGHRLGAEQLRDRAEKRRVNIDELFWQSRRSALQCSGEVPQSEGRRKTWTGRGRKPNWLVDALKKAARWTTSPSDGNAANLRCALLHHPEVVLGMLVPMLGLDGIACRGRFARKGNVTFVIPARIYGRPALPLLAGNIGVADRPPASVSVRADIHRVHLN